MEIKRIRRVGAGVGHEGHVRKRRMFHMGRGFSTCSSCQSQTPGTTDSGQDDRGIHDELSDEAGTHAQATAAFAQYIALDWPDIAYAVKTALQSMTKPDKLMLLRVVRVGMYLRQHPRLVWCFGQHFALVMQTSQHEKHGCARRRAQPWSLDISLPKSSPTQSRRALSTRGSTHSPR